MRPISEQMPRPLLPLIKPRCTELEQGSALCTAWGFVGGSLGLFMGEPQGAFSSAGNK